MMSRQPLDEAYSVTACRGCDRCADVCPVRAEDERFSPSGLLEKFRRVDGSLENDFTLWACTLCRGCTRRCPEPQVDFAGFVLALRAARFVSLDAHRPAHHGVLQRILSLPFKKEMESDRCWWVPQGRPERDPDTCLFVGCLPLLDRLFIKDLGYRPIQAAAGALCLLDASGVRPSVRTDEPCCGAQLYVLGDREGFMRLAKQVQAFAERSGARRLLTVCPQCAWMMNEVYPREGIEIRVQVQTAAAALAERADRLCFEERATAAALCSRLATGTGDLAYRELLTRVPGTDLLSLDPPLSSGLAGFHHCGPISRKVQAASLGRARQAGAALVLSTTPEDTVHLRCTIRPSSWQEGLIETRDAFEFLADALKQGDAE